MLYQTILSEELDWNDPDYDDYFMTGGCAEFAIAFQEIFPNTTKLVSLYGSYDNGYHDGFGLVHTANQLISKNPGGSRPRENLPCVDIRGWFPTLDALFTEFDFYDIEGRSFEWDTLDNYKRLKRSGNIALSRKNIDRAKSIITGNLDFYKPQQ